MKLKEKTFGILGILAWTCLSQAGVALAAAPFRVEIRLAEPAEVSPEASLGVARLFRPGQPEPASGDFPISGPGMLDLELPPGPGWTLQLASERFWAADLPLEAGAPPAVWLLHRTGRIGLGRPRNRPLPDAVAITFIPAARSSPAPPVAGRVSCTGDSDSRECRLPAGMSLDLRIEAEGYAPSFRWDVTVEAGARRELGPLPLVAGATLAGRIVDGRGEPLEAEIEALPSTHRDPRSADPEEIARLELAKVGARSDRKGTFQLMGIAPGAVDLRASAPGFPPALLARDIELAAGEALILPRDLVLRAALRCAVEILPERDPFGRPWQVELMPGAGEDLRSQRGAAGEDGAFLSKPTPPGRYQLRILDEQGQLWETRELELVAEGDPFFVEIPLLRVRGRVRLAGDPFAGALLLTRHPSMPAIRFPLDEDGRLDGYLPEEGRWLISLEDAEGRRRDAVAARDIRKTPGKSYVELEIEIPDTRIVGEVVDEAGEKVAGAQVDYLSFVVRGMASVKTGSDGSFEIFGVEPGQVSLTARHGAARSQGVVVEVAAGEPGERQRLVLAEPVEVAGLVTFSGAPQAGVEIQVWPELGMGSTASLVRASSGLDGRFRLEVPGYVHTLMVAAEGRGGERRLLRHAVGGGLLRVEMNVPRGELAVDLGAWMAGKGPEALLAVSLIYEGIELPQLMWLPLGLARRGDDGHFLFGRLEAGAYALCVGRRGGAAPPRCESGQLAPGGVLSLRPPE